MDSVAEIDEAGFGFQLDTIKRITDENGKLSYERPLMPDLYMLP